MKKTTKATKKTDCGCVARQKRLTSNLIDTIHQFIKDEDEISFFDLIGAIEVAKIEIMKIAAEVPENDR